MNQRDKESENPVVLLSGDAWHIVENSRTSEFGRCGHRLGERRAHARLRQVGAEHVCAGCLVLWRGE